MSEIGLEICIMIKEKVERNKFRKEDEIVEEEKDKELKLYRNLMNKLLTRERQYINLRELKEENPSLEIRETELLEKSKMQIDRIESFSEE